MMNKIVIAAAVVVTLILFTAAEKSGKLTPDVEKALNEKIGVVREFVKSKNIISEVEKKNLAEKKMSQADIKKLDEEWIASKKITKVIKGFMTNKLAAYLLEFQEENEGFAEIFITGIKGVNLAQTNKTSDYYQGDESWWTSAFNDGKGAEVKGEVEYDDSANTESIAIAIPVYNSAGKKVIGIIKVVIDITSIKSGV